MYPTKILVLFLSIMSFAYRGDAQSASLNSDSISITYRCPPCGCVDDGKSFEAPGRCPSCEMVLYPVLEGSTTPPGSRPMVRVALLLFDGADLMDVSGPWSVFEHARMNVFTVASSSETVRIGRTLDLQPDFTFDNMPRPDVIVLPGGGPAESAQDPQIVAWVRRFSPDSTTIFSVCSGAFFLGKAGLLDDREATTFASLIPQLEREFPNAKVRNDVKYTEDKNVITSAGLSSGIDASFRVIAKYYGEGRAQDIANHMEYRRSGQYEYVRSQMADHYLAPIQPLLRPFAHRYINSRGDHNKWECTYEIHPDLSKSNILIILNNEMQKNSSWQTSTISTTSLSGHINHHVLGTGIVTMTLLDKNGLTLLTVTAERKKVTDL